jgi:hypothetical protein
LLFIRGPQQSVLKTGLYTEGRFKPRRGRAFSFRLRSILDRKRRRFWTQALLKFRSLKTLVPLPQASRAAPLERAIVDKPTSERWLAPGESSWLLKAARFRPGLSVEWRRCRAAFNFIWGLNYARQWRLTQFFLRLRGLGGFSFLRLLALSAGQAIKHAFSNFFGPAFPSSRLFYFWAC